MDDDSPHHPDTIRHRQGRGLGAKVAVGGLLALGLLATACGGGSKDPAAAGSVSTSTTTTVASSGPSGTDPSGQSSQTDELQLAQCMRSHGVPDFPDPSGGGLLNAISAAGINTQTAAYQSALQTCKQYNPAASLSPAQSAADNAEGIEFSQCMRSHGVPNFPDPSVGPTGGQVINLHGTGIDGSSPTFQAANQACQKLVPGSK